MRWKYLGKYLVIGQLASEHVANVFAVEVTILDLNVFQEVVELLGGVLLTESQHGGLQVIDFNLALVVGESLEGGNDDLVLISGTTLLPLSEHVDELCEVDGRGAVGEHGVDLIVREVATDLVGGLADVGAADDAVLILVHHLEALLELGYLLLGELIEDIGSSLGLLGGLLGLLLGGRGRS